MTYTGACGEGLHRRRAVAALAEGWRHHIAEKPTRCSGAPRRHKQMAATPPAAPDSWAQEAAGGKQEPLMSDQEARARLHSVLGLDVGAVAGVLYRSSMLSAPLSPVAVPWRRSVLNFEVRRSRGHKFVPI